MLRLGQFAGLLFPLALRSFPLGGGLCARVFITQILALGLALFPAREPVAIQNSALHGRQNRLHRLVCHVQCACNILCRDIDIPARDIAVTLRDIA